MHLPANEELNVQVIITRISPSRRRRRSADPPHCSLELNDCRATLFFHCLYVHNTNNNNNAPEDAVQVDDYDDYAAAASDNNDDDDTAVVLVAAYYNAQNVLPNWD